VKRGDEEHEEEKDRVVIRKRSEDVIEGGFRVKG
jgi:hypothetical protein